MKLLSQLLAFWHRRSFAPTSCHLLLRQDCELERWRRQTEQLQRGHWL